VAMAREPAEARCPALPGEPGAEDGLLRPERARDWAAAAASWRPACSAMAATPCCPPPVVAAAAGVCVAVRVRSAQELTPGGTIGEALPNRGESVASAPSAPVPAAAAAGRRSGVSMVVSSPMLSSLVSCGAM
jgi:hypothetical protein